MKFVYLCPMQKPASILLAMWVLLLSTHIPLHAHFCSNVLVEACLYKEAKACCSTQKSTHDQPVFKKICCSDLEVVFDGYDDCASASEVDDVVLDLAFLDGCFADQPLVGAVENPSFSDKDPPRPSSVSLYILFEVYLI